MEVRSFTRPSGPSATASTSVWMTIIAAEVPPGTYLIVANTNLSSQLGAFQSGCRLYALPTGGGPLIELDLSVFSFLNWATHHLQGTAALPTGATLRLMGQGSRNWYAQRSSVIALKADVLSATTVPR